MSKTYQITDKISITFTDGFSDKEAIIMFIVDEKNKIEILIENSIINRFPKFSDERPYGIFFKIPLNPEKFEKFNWKIK
jgi:hypothetical protein